MITGPLAGKRVPGADRRDLLPAAEPSIIVARICYGMHYRTSGVHGSVIGRKVPHWIDKNYFQPVSQ